MTRTTIVLGGVAVAVALVWHLFLLPGSAQNASYEAEVSRLGLIPSQDEQPLVEEAIGIANEMLDGYSDLILTAGWAAPRPPDAKPVLVVRGLGLAQTDVMFVPEGKECVIIVERQMMTFLSKVADRGNYKHILALMLLHEVGHIHYGDPGSYTGREEVPLDALNLDTSAEKRKEARADLFAVGAVKHHLTDAKSQSRAADLCRALEDGLAVMNRNRPVAPFGQYRTHPKRVFWDSGYSHPNFDLRLLVMLAQLKADQESRDRLAGFLRMRERSGRAVLVLPTRGSKQRPYYQTRDPKDP